MLEGLISFDHVLAAPGLERLVVGAAGSTGPPIVAAGTAGLVSRTGSAATSGRTATLATTTVGLLATFGATGSAATARPGVAHDAAGAQTAFLPVFEGLGSCLGHAPVVVF